MGRVFSVFGFIDPMNFKKEKKCNLNELMGIELVSLICAAVFYSERFDFRFCFGSGSCVKS